jgi:hypothetical protein
MIVRVDGGPLDGDSFEPRVTPHQGDLHWQRVRLNGPNYIYQFCGSRWWFVGIEGMQTPVVDQGAAMKEMS